MNMYTFCSIKYMNRSFFSKTRYMIGVGIKKTGSHTRTKITPSYPPPHPGLDLRMSGTICSSDDESLFDSIRIPFRYCDNAVIHASEGLSN